MWYNNNLETVGKWDRISFLFGVIIIVFMFEINFTLQTHASETISTNIYPQNEFKLDFNQTDKINEVTAPINNLIKSTLGGIRLNQKINIGTGIPVSPIKSPAGNMDFGKFFGSSNVSSNDVVSFLKEAVTTVINLSILVISITTQVLKGLLSVLK